MVKKQVIPTTPAAKRRAAKEAKLEAAARVQQAAADAQRQLEALIQQAAEAKALLEKAEAQRQKANARNRARRLAAKAKAGTPAKAKTKVTATPVAGTAPVAAITAPTTPTDPTTRKKVTFVSLLVDRSGSMNEFAGRKTRNRLADDNFLAMLEALRAGSTPDNEFLVSTFAFARTTECRSRFHSCNVALHPPQFKGDTGATYLVQALQDVVHASVKDAKEILASLPGVDVAYMVVAFTDGGDTSQTSPRDLQQLIAEKTAEGNWTFGLQVPKGLQGEAAYKTGISVESITEWDVTSERSAEGMARKAVSAVSSYVVGRAAGVKANNKFFLNLDALTEAKLAEAATTPGSGVENVTAQLTRVPVTTAKIAVKKDAEISAYLTAQGYTFQAGQSYYELSKGEYVGATKDMLIQIRGQKAVFGGPGIRKLIGLPDNTGIPVSIENLKTFRVYVRSDSHNRLLVPGTEVLTACTRTKTATPAVETAVSLGFQRRQF